MIKSIRLREKEDVSRKDILKYAMFVFIGGLVLGVLSKWLDEVPLNEIPYMLEVLDLGNYFSRMAFWLFMAIWISIKSKRPSSASLNVFIFFSGMLLSYYSYTIFLSGFYPRSYIMIWVQFTCLSPLLAYLCWYAKDSGTVSMIISSLIVMIMLRQTFAFGLWYLDVMHLLELLTLIATLIILFESGRQIITILTLGSLLFFLSSVLVPFVGLL